MDLKKTVALGASAVMVLSGIGSSIAVADPSGKPAFTPVSDEERALGGKATNVVLSGKAAGIFSFTQGEVVSNSELGFRLATASKHLCGSQMLEGDQGGAAEDWELVVEGEVANPNAMSLAEYRDSRYAKTLVMGCSCLGNPTDGAASANAEISGIPLKDLIQAADPARGVNTVVFTSADGYEVALPYAYVIQKRGIVVFAVNGAPLAESVGGTNQLWLGSTPASYFARDIVQIRLETRQTPPPSPTSEEGRAQAQNLPNIGVLYGGTVR